MKTYIFICVCVYMIQCLLSKEPGPVLDIRNFRSLEPEHFLAPDSLGAVSSTQSTRAGADLLP